MGIRDERAWTEAWSEAYPGKEAAPDPAPRRRRFFRGAPPQTKAVVLATGMLVLGVSGIGVAQSTGTIQLGERNGTATDETEIIANEPATTNPKGGFSTRQSNLSTTGGGAIYGCRSTVGGTAANPPTNPCVRANNLSTGFAFEFNATSGESAGLITVGAGGDSRRPFTTNATGVATGLNADRVDGFDAAQIAGAAKTRWALVNAAGEIEAQSGGFTIAACYPAAPAAANGNCYINADEDLSDNGITSTIALQNGTDQNGDGIMNGRAPGPDNNPEFSGEISNAKCGTPGIVACAPDGTNNSNHLVVSPRNSDGTVTEDGGRKRFYVTVTPNT